MRKKLRARRKSLGYTQQEVADYVGIVRTYYSEIELGNRNCDIKIWLKIAEFLKIEEADLISYVKEGLKGAYRRGA